ncbi:MAG: hypothetical protein ACE37F_00800 [Nannocystaceae bacterium]|nr:hypothetical protein [bacterium]
MKPHHVLLALGAGYVLYEHAQKKKRRKGNRGTQTTPTTPDAPPARPVLDIASDCESWTMSDAWIIQVAQPRFALLLRERVRGQMQGRSTEADPIAMAYRILEGEHPGCPAPLVTAEDGAVLRFDALQADVPGMPDHYPHASILNLYAHITEAVLDALERFEISGNPDELLFPL